MQDRDIINCVKIDLKEMGYSEKDIKECREFIKIVVRGMRTAMSQVVIAHLDNEAEENSNASR